ncbi:MAG: transcriptional regulator, partial [Candidatus Bathyarchaeota archaeon]|nr:transcriptional regulator [Candidatus Bathyarchaeota archaeon]
VHSALEAVKRGGVIVLVAECPEGHGDEVFYEWMTKFKSLKQMEKEIKRRFRVGGHKAYYLTKALKKSKIFLVSVMPDYYALNVFRLKTTKAVNDALIGTFDIVGKKAKVWAMPYGNLTLPVMKS